MSITIFSGQIFCYSSRRDQYMLNIRIKNRQEERTDTQSVKYPIGYTTKKRSVLINQRDKNFSPEEAGTVRKENLPCLLLKSTKVKEAEIIPNANRKRKKVG